MTKCMRLWGDWGLLSRVLRRDGSSVCQSLVAVAPERNQDANLSTARGDNA